MRPLWVCVLLIPACATTQSGTGGDADTKPAAKGSSGSKKSGKSSRTKSKQSSKPKTQVTYSDDRPTPKATKAEWKEFARIWEYFRKDDPRWPVERDRFKRRSDAAAYLLAGHLLQYYMQLNFVRDAAYKRLERVKKEVVAVGEPAAPVLVDMMVLPRIPMRDGRDFLTDDITRQDCREMLEGMGGTAVSYLLRALERKDMTAKGRHFAALALGGTKDTRAYDPLVKLLRDDPAWEVRFSAATALGKLGDRRAVRPLYESMQFDPDKSVKRRAAEARRALLLAAAKG